MNKTSIEWVRNPDGSQGYTFNPITGCLNNCSYCYARRLANTRLKQRYLANPNTAVKYQAETTIEEYERQRTDPFYPRFWRRQLVGGSPKGIFVCDMGELFGDWIPSWWKETIFAQIRCFKQHRFYLLTKQPQNLLTWSPFPPNCFVGVSATDHEMAFNASCNLIPIQASVKYVSFEPLLGHVGPSVLDLLLRQIQWVIIGSQTKPYKPPKIEWVREIVAACDKAGIPVFLKENLKSLLHCPEANMPILWEDYPFKLRQEMPS